MKRHVLWTLLLLNGLLLCLPLLMLVSLVNPMQSMFIVPVTIENRTSETIRVTPVGVGDSGNRSLLAVFLWQFPAVWGIWNRDFEILSGGSLQILYGWDDVWLSEIVVHDLHGRAFVATVDSPRGQAIRLDIDDLAALAAPSPEVLGVARSGFHNWPPWLVLIVSVTVIPASFSALWRAYRRAVRYRQTSARGVSGPHTPQAGGMGDEARRRSP